MSGEAKPATAGTLSCPDCGRTWVCDPAGACWCMALPPRLPLPRAGAEAACLCPCKLEALSSEAG